MSDPELSASIGRASTTDAPYFDNSCDELAAGGRGRRGACTAGVRLRRESSEQPLPRLLVVARGRSW